MSLVEKTYTAAQAAAGTTRRYVMVCLMLAMGFAGPGAAQQPPPLAPSAPPVAAPTSPAYMPRDNSGAAPPTADTAIIAPGQAPPATDLPPELPASMLELRAKGKVSAESIVTVSDELRNMVMVAKQEGDVIRAECVGAKRQYVRVLVNTGWEQLNKMDEALKAGDGLRATYSFMTLDTSRSKAQDLMTEAHACVGSRMDAALRVDVQAPLGGGRGDPTVLGPIGQKDLDRPPAASPYH